MSNRQSSGFDKHMLSGAFVVATLLAGLVSPVDASAPASEVREIRVRNSSVSVSPLAAVPRGKSRPSSAHQAEPKCKWVRKGFGRKEDCSARDMHRKITTGSKSHLQAAVVALLNDKPIGFQPRNKYDFVKAIPNMSDSCINGVRGILLNTLAYKEFNSKNLDVALGIANSWDVVWGIIGTTKHGSVFMANLSAKGLSSAAKILSRDIALGKLEDVLKLNPISFWSDALKSLSKAASYFVEGNISREALMNVYSLDSGRCHWQT